MSKENILSLMAIMFIIGFVSAALLPTSAAEERPIQSIVMEVPKASIPKFEFEYNARSLYCLADAIYNEAGIESEQGKEAVGMTILNRTQNTSTKNVCSVIAQSRIVNGEKVCQFSYYCMPKRYAYGKNWEDSLFVAAKLLHNKIDVELYTAFGSATHYHAVYVKPFWRKSMTYLGRIGNHHFYKEE